MTRMTTEVRGVAYEVHSAGDPLSAINVLALALLALDDPRVDRVLRDLGVVFHTAGGVQAWPPPGE